MTNTFFFSFHKKMLLKFVISQFFFELLYDSSNFEMYFLIMVLISALIELCIFKASPSVKSLFNQTSNLMLKFFGGLDLSQSRKPLI